MPLCAGDLVEVRSKEEILATLDKNGRLDELPFMPQMFDYCGQRFPVMKRAHKTCDPIYTMAARRIDACVHLNLRCNGAAFGGCQAGCLLFWKEAWLKPAHEGASTRTAPEPGRQTATEEDVRRACTLNEPDGRTRYVCQTTQLPQFTTPLSWWNLTQYVEDYRSGNVSLATLLRGAVYVVCGRHGVVRLPILRRIHDAIQSLIGGMPSPVRNGLIPLGEASPVRPLGLAPGELVRTKTHAEILETINRNNWHGGLYFDVEMVPYCGKTYRVAARVDRFIDEKTGRMRRMKIPAVILQGVACNSQFSKCRMFCPRSIYSWWREEWLERVEEAPTEAQDARKTANAPPIVSVVPACGGS